MNDLNDIRWSPIKDRIISSVGDHHSRPFSTCCLKWSVRVHLQSNWLFRNCLAVWSISEHLVDKYFLSCGKLHLFLYLYIFHERARKNNLELKHASRKGCVEEERILVSWRVVYRGKTDFNRGQSQKVKKLILFIWVSFPFDLIFRNAKFTF